MENALAREMLEGIAHQFGGEYDGWEAEVVDETS